MKQIVAPRRARGTKTFSAHVESLETRRLLAIVVNTTVDESVANATTSLREAIARAAANPGDDEITFDEEVFTPGSLHTITPTTELIINDASGMLTIQGPGDDVLAISALSAGRSFTINGGVVVLSGMTIRDGLGKSEGGGIFNSTTLTLENVILTNNVVTGETGEGGDPVNPADAGGTARGGAIYNTGTLNIINATFTANAANGGAGGAAANGGGEGGNGYGGAIFMSGGTLTMEDTDLSGNFASGGVGGTSDTSGAHGGGAFGGAIFMDTGVFATIINSPMAGNTASGGPGANAGATGNGGDGGDAGGGAIWSNAEDLSLIDTSFASNQVLAGGGGNAGSGGNAGAGGDASGGALVNAGLMTINGGTINGNSLFGGDSTRLAGDALGGGLYNSDFAAVQNVQFVSNVAFAGASAGGTGGNAHGGAIFANATFDISDSLLTFNVAKGGNGPTAGSGTGGGIYVDADVDIITTTVSFNTATGGLGAAGTAGAAGGTAQGGGIHIEAGVVTVLESTIDHNTVTGGHAGMGSAGAGGTGGVAAGGGVSSGGSLKLANSTIYGNSVTGGNGGAGSTTGGAGGDAFGGGIYSSGASLTVIHATIAANLAQNATGGAGGAGGAAGNGRGGGIFSSSPAANLSNSIVDDNSAAASADDLAGAFVATFSLIGTAPDGSYNLNVGSIANIIGQDADLGALGNNGGPTETAKPNAASPAINAGDNAAAIAQFGVDATDQRGVGFPRIIETVDMGAVETGGAVISVSGNGVVIENFDDTPFAGDNTNFGSVVIGAAAVQRTFVVSNTGNVALEIDSLEIPEGFALIEGLSSTIAAGGNDSFTIALPTNVVGTFEGDVVIETNIFETPIFSFAIVGTVTNPPPPPPPPPPPSSPIIRVNFQAPGSATPTGYLADAGTVFGARGNGFTYGWNLSASGFTRDRNATSDQLRDTLVHMQLYGNRTWEVQVPNGTYRVRLVAGDPSYFDSVYRINVEGVLGVTGTPTSGSRFVEGTVTVRVADGRLTLTNASGSANNKLNFIEITPVTAINFQTTGSATPIGYLADAGVVFGNRGNGFSYGWNATASTFARDRNAGNSPDQRYDTLIHTQLYGTRTWEVGVANGTYLVRIVAGDPSYTDSVYRFNVEGILAATGTPTSSNRWIEGTVSVLVTDGRLTITNASGAVNNKIAFVEFTKTG